MNAPEKINPQRPLGIVRGMSLAEYLAVDALSASDMRHLARSAWHYRNRVEEPATAAMLGGSLVHCAQLEPDALAARYLVAPADAPRRPSSTQRNAKKPSEATLEAIAWWDEFNRRAAGRTIVSADEYELTRQQLAAIQAATGVYCKARPDFLQWVDAKRVRVAEIKSTHDESPEGFSRALSQLGYHRARAHYIEGVQHATGAQVVEYVFAVVSSAPPVLAVPYWLDDADAQQGAEECAELRELFRWCTHANEWPAYGTGPQIVGLKPWARRNNETEVSFVDA